MFSVVIPLYNKANYVEKAVRSILGQSFEKFEIIIVNDGSTDNSLEIVQKISDERIQIIDQKNSGVSTARNNGVKKARYHYLSFLDADDWWAPNYLEEVSNLISKYNDAGIYGTKYCLVKDEIKKDALIGVEPNFTEGYIDYFRTYLNTMWMPIYPCCVTLPKSIFDKFGGFRSNLKFGEDFELWSKIACEHKIAYLNKSLVCYNQDVDIENRAVGINKIYHPNSHFIFNLNSLEKHEHENKILKKLLDKMRSTNLLKYYINAAYKTEVKKEYEKIDFSNIPFSTKIQYFCPPRLLKLLLKIRIRLSQLKKNIKKRI